MEKPPLIFQASKPISKPIEGPDWYRIKLTHKQLFIILKSLNRFSLGTRKRFIGNQRPIAKIICLLDRHMPKEKWAEYKKEWDKIREEFRIQSLPKKERPKPEPEKPIRGKGFYCTP